MARRLEHDPSLVRDNNAPGKESMALEHGKHFDGTRSNAIDDSIRPNEDLTHILPLELRNNTPRERSRRSVPCPLSQTFHPTSRNSGFVRCDTPTDGQEVLPRLLGPA
jgi:hypothetical protein